MEINREVNRFLRTLRSLGMATTFVEATEWVDSYMRKEWRKYYEDSYVSLWAAAFNRNSHVCNSDMVLVNISFTDAVIKVVIENYSIYKGELSEPETRHFSFPNNVKYPANSPFDILSHIQDLRQEKEQDREARFYN